MLCSPSNEDVPPPVSAVDAILNMVYHQLRCTEGDSPLPHSTGHNLSADRHRYRQIDQADDGQAGGFSLAPEDRLRPVSTSPAPNRWRHRCAFCK